MLPPKFRPLYNHSAGPKTVFFWAPVFKWGLVVAGFSDMTRPPEKLSLSQSCVITATGFIWSRYCLVIIPKIWALFAVNFFLGICGSIQLFRIWSALHDFDTCSVVLLLIRSFGHGGEKRAVVGGTRPHRWIYYAGHLGESRVRLNVTVGLVLREGVLCIRGGKKGDTKESAA
ncbi:Mitochondrial pyruvate carrier 2 [Triplophysa tibetana]|uniref:Mitochondrial pyruvate carrier n=1 Tax=Triplophysa tibetana TaxID=1572043 RepID=A0A5A9PP36_9TELE|nr:Mitochondrial pyruvate carrier 2 [Triplophysa tibetana]